MVPSSKEGFCLQMKWPLVTDWELLLELLTNTQTDSVISVNL